MPHYKLFIRKSPECQNSTNSLSMYLATHKNYIVRPYCGIFHTQEITEISLKSTRRLYLCWLHFIVLSTGVGESTSILLKTGVGENTSIISPSGSS